MLFLKAILLGQAIAASPGPIGAPCIARPLRSGFAAWFAGGFGTALADAAYAAAAAFGFAALAGGLDGGLDWVRLIGGVLSIGLGIKGWLIPAREVTPARASARTLIATAGATFALTIANPSTILSFVAMFAGLGLAEDPGAVAAATAVAGVFSGLAGLVGGAAGHRRADPPPIAGGVRAGGLAGLGGDAAGPWGLALVGG